MSSWTKASRAAITMVIAPMTAMNDSPPVPMLKPSQNTG